ncbi:MAG TPA: response regulator, partial [Bacillota bacterium]|nr:response regulator [Bacillota bacterium]
MARVLLLDDELTLVQTVAGVLRQDGHEVFPFTNGEVATTALPTLTPDLVITDLYLDGARAHGLEVLKKARELVPAPVVMVITGFASIETAKEAMRHGAFDYLEKPFKLDEFRLSVQRALSYNAAVTETVYLRKELKRKYQFSQIVGSAPRMQQVFKLIERVTDTDSTILILGESGTGKELVAR